MTDGRENRPEARTVVALQRDQRAEKKAVRDKAAGAVNRIQNPAIANAVDFFAFFDAKFLAENSMLRVTRFNELAKEASKSSKRNGVKRSISAGVAGAQ